MKEHITIPDYSDWTPDQITYQIMDHHHDYIRRKVLSINALLDQVTHQIDQQLPELSEIRSMFYKLGEELLEHIEEEESDLFPYILQLTSAQKLNTDVAFPHIPDAKNPIHIMEDDHCAVKDYLKNIRLLAADFIAPSDASESVQKLYAMLREFEADLQLHIYLEDIILFPSISKLEAELKK